MATRTPTPRPKRLSDGSIVSIAKLEGACKGCDQPIKVGQLIRRWGTKTTQHAAHSGITRAMLTSPKKSRSTRIHERNIRHRKEREAETEKAEIEALSGTVTVTRVTPLEGESPYQAWQREKALRASGADVIGDRPNAQAGTGDLAGARIP